MNSPQKSAIWYEERQLRLTGSRCYAVYTFSKADWSEKAKNFFWPKELSNKYVEHGLKYKSEALEEYKIITKYDVRQLGLIICKNFHFWIIHPM
ncbi:hypothetical protein YQE_02325, partial [Dendroctonus ponderosae]